MMPKTSIPPGHAGRRLAQHPRRPRVPVRLGDPPFLFPRRALPLLVPVGGAETTEWIKQTRAYVDLCQANGINAQFMDVPGADHFDMTAAMGDEAGPVLPAILQQMGL